VGNIAPDVPLRNPVGGLAELPDAGEAGVLPCEQAAGSTSRLITAQCQK
jgi:hypothetical protein